MQAPCSAFVRPKALHARYRHLTSIDEPEGGNETEFHSGVNRDDCNKQEVAYAKKGDDIVEEMLREPADSLRFN